MEKDAILGIEFRRGPWLSVCLLRKTIVQVCFFRICHLGLNCFVFWVMSAVKTVSLRLLAESCGLFRHGSLGVTKFIVFSMRALMNSFRSRFGILDMMIQIGGSAVGNFIVCHDCNATAVLPVAIRRWRKQDRPIMKLFERRGGSDGDNSGFWWPLASSLLHSVRTRAIRKFLGFLDFLRFLHLLGSFASLKVHIRFSGIGARIWLEGALVIGRAAERCRRMSMMGRITESQAGLTSVSA